MVFMSRIWIGREGVTFREEGGRGFEEIGEGWLDWNGYSNLILIGMIDFGSFRCTGGEEGGFELLVRCMEGLICEEI